MPYSNTIGTTPDSLTSIAVYLANDGHAHHKDYELTPIQVLGAKSVQDFIDYAKGAFQKNKRKGAGRPPKNAANWFIVRTPDGSHLEPHEMAAYENAARDVAGLGGPVVGILNWHRNKYTGAADMNLLAAAFTSSGERVRDRDANPIKTLRWRMDQVTDALNLLRKSRGIPPIVTMQEVKNERAQQRGEMDLVVELARLPKPPKITAELEPALIKLECSISRFNPSRDTISITPKGKKKAKRFSVSKLLADVADMVGKLRTKTPSPAITPPEKEPKPLPEITAPPLPSPQITAPAKMRKPAAPTIPAFRKTKRKPQDPGLSL